MTVISKSIHSSEHTSHFADQAAERANASRLVTLVTLLLIFAMAARTPLDSDMWWHLKAGEHMLDTGRWLLQDIYSFTAAGAPWINTHWLFEVALAALYRAGGFLGLSALVAGLAVVSMAGVERQCAGSPALKAAALLLGSVVASTCWPPRPLIASLALLAWTGYILYLNKWRGRDYLWLLPPLFILWSNTHAGYTLGLILIGCHIAGELLNHALGVPVSAEGGGALAGRRVVRLVGIGIACGLAALINPNGLDTWRLPFQTVQMQALQQFIPEWASPDFHQPIEMTLLVLLLALFGAAALAGRRMDGSDLITCLLFGAMALLARRNFGPFAVVAVPVLTRSLSAAVEAARNSPRTALPGWLAALQKPGARSPAGSPALRRVINLSIVGLLGGLGIVKLYAVSHPALVGAYVQTGYPAQAAQWLEQSAAPGRVFNEYDWGGYLQWRLDGFTVFVDGRTDLFGDLIIEPWTQAVQARPGWQTVLDQYAVDYVLLKPERPLVEELEEAGWIRVYADPLAVIYARSW